MFVRSSKGGRTAALLISGLLAALVLTGSASPRTTYHITDGEAVYTVTGQPDDTEGALALRGRIEAIVDGICRAGFKNICW